MSINLKTLKFNKILIQVIVTTNKFAAISLVYIYIEYCLIDFNEMNLVKRFNEFFLKFSSCFSKSYLIDLKRF